MSKYLLTLLGILTFAIAGCPRSNPPPARTDSSPSPAASSTPPASTTDASFVAVDEPTKGTAKIVAENGQNFLVLNESFSTKEGPDVFVLLHKEAVPKNYTESNYLSLGKLQKISGTQRYAIPAGTNLKDFRTVALWCRKFNVTFGYAPIP